MVVTTMPQMSVEPRRVFMQSLNVFFPISEYIGYTVTGRVKGKVFSADNISCPS